MTSNQKLHNLSFVSAESLGDNLTYALSSIGQTLGYQKHQEMVARLQGYQSANHRPKHDRWADNVTFLYSDIVNATGVDEVSLKADYLRVTFGCEHLEKMLKAVEAVRHLDEWGSMAMEACMLEAYEDVVDVEWVAVASAEDVMDSLDRQEIDHEALVATQDVQVHVYPKENQLWVSGQETHGFYFRTLVMDLDQLVKTFEDGTPPNADGWTLLEVRRLKRFIVSFVEEKGDRNVRHREMMAFDEDGAEDQLRKEFPLCEVRSAILKED